MLLDACEVQRKRQCRDGERQHDRIGALPGEKAEDKISGYTDYGNRNTVNNSIGTVIDDTAIPALVDVAWSVSVGSVVLAKRQR
jgi:hypothetical protein